MSAKDKQYFISDDGLPAENVGNWANDKLKILTDYIQASGATRRKYLRSGAGYIDVFCGPGRSRIRTTGDVIDGSPVAAFKQGQRSLAPFTSIEISDANSDLLAAAANRLHALGAPVRATPGPADVAIDQIVKRLNPTGLHIAFLDPHNLGALSFSLFESLAQLKRIDIIAHVSVSDLQRNVDRYSSELFSQFDSFAPGWRTEINTDMNQVSLRTAILRYWSEKVSKLGLPRARQCELVTGHVNQRLYWLIFLSPNKFAHGLWTRISSLARAPKFGFDD
jgi:three-Cys-motif partner protein